MFDTDKYAQAWREAAERGLLPPINPNILVIGGITREELGAVVELLNDKLQDWLPGENDEARELVQAAEEKLSKVLRD